MDFRNWARGVLGFLLAVLVGAISSGASMTLITLHRTGWNIENAEPLSSFVLFSVFVGIYAGGFAAPFAIIACWTTRLMRWPRPLSEIVAGFLIGALFTYVFRQASDPGIPYLAVTFGALSGYVYWRAVGRPKPSTREAAAA